MTSSLFSSSFIVLIPCLKQMTDSDIWALILLILAAVNVSNIHTGDHITLSAHYSQMLLSCQVDAGIMEL